MSDVYSETSLDRFNGQPGGWIKTDYFHVFTAQFRSPDKHIECFVFHDGNASLFACHMILLFCFDLVGLFLSQSRFQPF